MQTSLSSKAGYGFIPVDDNLILSVLCSTNVLIGDAVYFSAANTVSKANALNISTAKVCGFIDSKQSSTECTLRISGILVKTGLFSNQQYFLDTSDGQINPLIPTDANSVIVKVGISKSTTELLVEISPERVVR